MAEYNGIPVYQVTVNEEDINKGLDFISLVDSPAIMTDFIAMAKDIKLFLSADRQMLYGPILIPDQLIYRNDVKMGDYYIQFSRQEIEKLVRKFQAEQKTVNLNYQHQDASKIQNAVIQEIWLTGNPDKSQSMGFDLPEGTAFIGAHIGDVKFWNEEVKTGKVRGFSIEGFLDIQLNKQKMSQTKLIEANAVDGTLIKSDNETFAQGNEVYTEKDGAKEIVPDGEYDLGNGEILKVKDSKIEEIMQVETEEQALRKLLEPITKEFEAKIQELKKQVIELETKLENQPAKPTPKPTPKEETILTKVERLREMVNKNKN